MPCFQIIVKQRKMDCYRFDEDFFIQLGIKLNIKVEIIKDLTIHTGRYSVLITF
jgi:energy-converting hydrogenase A subunit M